MLETIKKILKDLFTEDDNESADMIMFCAFAGFGTFLGLEIYEVIFKATPFDMTGFGTAFGLMLAGLGVAFNLKRSAQAKPLAEG